MAPSKPFNTDSTLHSMEILRSAALHIHSFGREKLLPCHVIFSCLSHLSTAISICTNCRSVTLILHSLSAWEVIM